jgi:hypothetical protein
MGNEATSSKVMEEHKGKNIMRSGYKTWVEL